MKIVINPTYVGLREWIAQLPENFATQGEVIYDARNQIRLMQAPDGTRMCVKRFHKPQLLNQYFYRFRKSKAHRAYENGLYMLAHEVNTPGPVAYIEEYRFGGLAYSYLVTRMSELRHLHREFTLDYRPELDKTIRPLARFVAHMHNEGINHLDFSPGNILWDLVDGKYRFEVVDNNRMTFGSVSLKEGCCSIRRICARRSFFDTFAEEYAKARGMDEAQCRYWIHYYRDRFWQNGRKANYQYD